MNAWTNLLTLNSDRTIRNGSAEALAAAIRRGADLRVRTDFRHNEHIDTASDNPEMVRETSEFRVTYLVENRWVAGVMTLRQPISGPEGFGPRSSMSFFLYNQDGHQAIARPYLDGVPARGERGPAKATAPDHMPKYHAMEAWDADTNAPSQNFIYDFEFYQFFLRDDWREVLHHDANGRVVSGSLAELVEAFSAGCDLKVGLRGLCGDLGADSESAVDHEVFVRTGSNYYYTERKLFFAGSHPLVRIRPSIPMQYTSGGWDFGWLLVRADGVVISRLGDPYTLKFRQTESRLAMRWFAR